MVEDAAVVWEQGFGFKNLLTRDPVTQGTLFQAASLSKPIFAYVVMGLVEHGELALDDALVDYVRPADLAEGPWGEQITVRDALQHTSGLPNWRADKDGPDPLRPAYAPGTDTSYSGEAYHWLQRVVEKVTGLGLDALMRERLFRPAALDDMAMVWDPSRDAREVFGHVFNDADELVVDDLQFIREHGGRLNEVAVRWGRPMRTWTAQDHERAALEIRPHTHPRLKDEPAWAWARPGAFIIDSASSLRSTAGDYARFVAMMMPGRGPGGGQRGEATRQRLLTPQYERPDVQGGVLPRGLGWGLEKRENGVAFYHWGKNGRSHMSVALGDATTRRGIVVMTNGSNGKALIRDVVTELMGTNYIGITT